MKNKLEFRLTRLVFCTLLLLIYFPAYAQQPSDGTFTIKTDLVVTWAKVTTRSDGLPVKGLSINDVRLSETGKPQRIALFEEGSPLSVVILVDGMTCLSEPNRWYQQREAILRQLGEGTEVALMAWDSDTVLVQPFTTNMNAVAEKLSDKLNFFYALNPGPYGTDPLSGNKNVVRPNRTGYRPGEAIFQATKYLEKHASPKRRKIIVVVSYSKIRMAENHLHKADEVKEVLQKTGTTVYALYHHTSVEYKDHFYPISYVDAAISFPLRLGKRTQQRKGGTLDQFVELTGGSSLTGEWEECDSLFAKLAKQIHSSYTIGYYPENTSFDGQFRRINVELSQSGKAKAGKADIKARVGYFAIRPESMANNVVVEKQK